MFVSLASYINNGAIFDGNLRSASACIHVTKFVGGSVTAVMALA